jgi:hypothetical protein
MSWDGVHQGVDGSLLLARPRSLRHRSDSVSYERNFDRAAKATGMPHHDPQPSCCRDAPSVTFRAALTARSPRPGCLNTAFIVSAALVEAYAEPGG